MEHGGTYDDFAWLVRKERNRQDEKWGIQDHNPYYWLSILVEEVGEVAHALCGKRVSMQDCLEELVHVGAVAKAMYESGYRQGWK